MGIESQEILSRKDMAAEYLLMGLRINEGISIDRFNKLSDTKLNSEEISFFINSGLLSQNSDRLRATDQGRLVLNAVTERLLLS